VIGIPRSPRINFSAHELASEGGLHLQHNVALLALPGSLFPNLIREVFYSEYPGP